MISYCICCYRPHMDILLIEELIRKTSVPYEILLWINTENPDLKTFIDSKVGAGLPVKVVGMTPKNIGMAAFKSLFKASKYDMITQLDDDVTLVTPQAAQIAADIFRRHPSVKMLTADVWQDKHTNGAHPKMNSYKSYSKEDGLYEGPIDGGFSVFHRSIFPLLMKIPYQKYFYLGAWVRGGLPSSGQLGLLCTKIRIFHVYGAYYASAYDLLDFEIAKFRNVGLGHIADGFEISRKKLPSKEVLLASVEGVKKEFEKLPYR